jgi:hypothetical protein
MTEPSLESYLDFQCRYLAEAVQTVPAGKDLRPLMSWVGEDGKVGVMIEPILFNSGREKDLTVAMFKSCLRQARAVRYAIISACWIAQLSLEEGDRDRDLIRREGTGGKYKDRRSEAYQITVGDRERTLMAGFDVRRDYKGKIRQLIAREGPSAHTLIEGRFFDLLATRH